MLFKNRDKLINNGLTPELKEVRRDILDIFASATESVDPYNAVKSKFDGNTIVIYDEIIDVTDFSNIYLIGFGKASIGMADAVCDSINIKSGAVITNDSDQFVQSSCITTLVGSHPVPDKNNQSNSKYC